MQGLVQNYTWITGTGLIGWPYLLLYVLVPVFIARKYAMRLPQITGWRNCTVALPFVLIYLLALIVLQGISASSLFTLFAVTVWPAFGEELLYRGFLQPALIKITKNPITAIVPMSVLFAASHIPTYVLATSGPAVLGWSGLLPIMLTAFFWGYGYYRTGILWPWIMIHALSNLVSL